MPRFGFAYRPLGNDKMAVRGGFGFYNINMLGSSFYSLTGTVQAQTQQFNNTYNPATHAIGYQWPTIYAGAGGAAGVGGYGTDYFGTANSTNWKDPYTEQWSLERRTRLRLGLRRARLLHRLGDPSTGLGAGREHAALLDHRLGLQPALSAARLFPNWGRINTRATGANESYNSLQVEASHRLQHGLEYHSGLTWAKSSGRQPGTGRHGLWRRRRRRSAPPRSSTGMWTSAMSTEPAGCAGTRPFSTTCPSAAAKLMGSDMPRAGRHGRRRLALVVDPHLADRPV